MTSEIIPASHEYSPLLLGVFVCLATASIRNLSKSPDRCVRVLLKSQSVRLVEHLPLIRRADMATSPTRCSRLFLNGNSRYDRAYSRNKVRVRTLEFLRDRNEQGADRNLGRDSFEAVTDQSN